ncbi:MAG: lipopolysaccharide biosynthesis [Geobacteraceae bacterium]|nr:MAG: lipopolysaccharide biosynthesis [Geobacteraceae bacterium]
METQSNDIRKYFKMVQKRKCLFITISLSIMSIIVWGSYFLPKQYEATSTVFIEKNIIKDLVKGITITPSVEDKIRVLRYALLSRVFVTKVLQDIDIDTKIKNEKELEALVAKFQHNTQISIKGNDLFIVTYRDKDPRVAMNYVNTLVRKYVEENISGKREESYGANRFLTEQLNVFKEKLGKSENDIIKYRQQRGVFVAIDENALVSGIKNYQTEIENIQIRKKEISAIRDSIKRQLKGEEPFTVAVLSSRRSEGGGSQIPALENKIKQLLVSYTENYPEVIKLRAEIDAIKKQNAARTKDETANTPEPEMSTLNPIHQDLKQKLFQAESELEAINAKQRQLQATIGIKEGELRNVPEGKKKLADLESERNSAKQIYEQLMLRQGQSELSKQMEVEDKASTFRIVDPAVLPKKPVSPDRIKMILAGIVIGFVGGFGGVYLRETLDSSIKDTQTLKTLGLEVLAVIPKMINEVEQKKETKKDRLVYAASGFYFSIICFSLVHELMGLTLIERVINKLGLDKLIGT